ncbi:hypothetical protein LTR86_010793 [Recurvomyces mirabilis]|nr:hypothetical protein LTR86_010793 [Recurvomyces mirabilis]
MENPESPETAVSNWPGERRPTQEEVQQASELPDRSFMTQFKKALLNHEDSKGYRELLDRHPMWPHYGDGLEQQSTTKRTFTYPMSLLADFPELPPSNDLKQLRSVFSTAYGSQIHVKELAIAGSADAALPPYLLIAFACIGSTLYHTMPASDGRRSGPDLGSRQLARDLFYAGYQLSTFMVEVDNRLSRTLETVLGIALLTTYGILAADHYACRLAESMFTYGLTMARGLRVFDVGSRARYGADLGANGTTSSVPGPYTSRFKRATPFMRLLISSRSVAYYLFLIDTVRAINRGTTTFVSPTELSIALNSTSTDFRDLYGRLFFPLSIPNTAVAKDEDAMLLLTALLSDLLLAHRLTLAAGPPRITTPPDLQHQAQLLPPCNPFVPFSPLMERKRLQGKLSDALTNWHELYSREAIPETMAFYYYCRLLLVCPQLLELPQLAHHMPVPARPPNIYMHYRQWIAVPAEAHRLAWKILDHSTTPLGTSHASVTAIWLPPMVFQAGLAVWQYMTATSSKEVTSFRMLEPFVRELEKMPWPCCVEMVATFKGLPALQVDDLHLPGARYTDV